LIIFRGVRGMHREQGEEDIGNISLKKGIIDQEMEPVMIIAQP
jgi:hypothetical protein